MSTSEERHGIPAQPEGLCYHIDFGVHPALMAGDVPAAESALTMLRQEIVALRAWGEAWKRLALSRQDPRQIEKAEGR
jgi:hypothetical protein